MTPYASERELTMYLVVIGDVVQSIQGSTFFLARARWARVLGVDPMDIVPAVRRRMVP